MLKDAGIQMIQIGYQAPNMNAIAERWILSVKCECISCMIFFGVNSLWRALAEYRAHWLIASLLDHDQTQIGEARSDECLGGNRHLGEVRGQTDRELRDSAGANRDQRNDHEGVSELEEPTDSRNRNWRRKLARGAADAEEHVGVGLADCVALIAPPGVELPV